MLYPLNRYLVVKPLEEEKTISNVIIPEDADIASGAFRLVEILKPHVSSELKTGMKVLVPNHMVEETIFFGKTYYLVLENHVMGYVGE